MSFYNVDYKIERKKDNTPLTEADLASNLEMGQGKKKQKITHYWNYKGQPTKNGHIERFNRTIQEKFIDWNETLLEDIDRFNHKLVDWLLWYNTERFHWSLKLETPVDYLINNGPVSKMCWTNTCSWFNF